MSFNYRYRKKSPKILGYAKYCSIIVSEKKSPNYWDTQNIVQLSLLQKNSQNIGICKISFNYRYRKNPQNIGISKISLNYRYCKKSPKYWDTQNIVQLSLAKKNPQTIGIRKISSNYRYCKKIPKILVYAKYRSIIVTEKIPKILG